MNIGSRFVTFGGNREPILFSVYSKSEQINLNGAETLCGVKNDIMIT